MSFRARFFCLGFALLALLSAGELVGRRAGNLMGAIAHRARFKVELLKARGSADFVVLGSSRGNDCVAPGPIGRALSMRGASVATPSSSLQTLEYVAREVADTKGLKVAFIELSRRQLQSEPLELDAVAAPDAADPIGSFLSQHSALLRGRRAFAVENWSRVPALLMPAQYDGSEFFHTRWLSEAFASVEPATVSLEPSSDAPGEAPADAVAVYRRVVESFRARGVKVLLYGPPLAQKKQEVECDAVSRGQRAAIAAAVDAPLDDYACVKVDETWLTDRDEHCGAVGRERFSTLLGARAKTHTLSPEGLW